MLIANNGNDRLNGGVGNDRLYGGADHDILVDLEGINLLDGGAGNDHLTGEKTIYRGGEGDDIFVLRNALNFIEDFGRDADQIQVDVEAFTGLTLAELEDKPLLHVVRSYVDTGRAANDSTIRDVIIYNAKLTEDRADDVAVMVIEDYEGALTAAHFDLI